MHIVLSGSGVNLGAHAGALYEMTYSVQKKGKIEIEEMTAVSGGSIVGGLYAIGYKPEDIIEAIKEFDFKKVNFTLFPLFSLTFRGYLYSDSYINKTLKRFFHGITLGSTQIPINVIATDDKGKTVVFSSRRTPKVTLFDAVRASMAAPLIFRPHMGLYDGGITNNMPIDLVDCPPSEVIGVKVFSEKDYITRGKANKKGLIGTMTFLLKTLMNTLDREHIEEHADRVIFVPCPNSSFDFDIPQSVIEFHIAMGRYMTDKFFDIVNSEVLSRLIDLHNEIIDIGYGLKNMEKYLFDRTRK